MEGRDKLKETHTMHKVVLKEMKNNVIELKARRGITTNEEADLEILHLYEIKDVVEDIIGCKDMQEMVGVASAYLKTIDEEIKNKKELTTASENTNS